MAWRTAVYVVCGLLSANMLLRARPICRQKLLGNPKCPRRADNLLSYVLFQTSKNYFARQCDRRILRILVSFRTGQRGQHSDVSSCTLRSRVLNCQTLCPIVHSSPCQIVAGISSHSEDHHAHFTRSGKQSEIVWSAHREVFAR